ncbi:MAG: hypothetical protein IPG56_06385 [Caulobacteraceae bacterium]|nr:hypothetical protein [Caulobacteraceae bacterium]
MSEFKRVTPDFTVAAQLGADDIARAAAEGYTTIIVNRALAQALVGSHTPDEIIALAQKAGYDLSGARGALETLAPKA